MAQIHESSPGYRLALLGDLGCKSLEPFSPPKTPSFDPCPFVFSLDYECPGTRMILPGREGDGSSFER